MKSGEGGIRTPGGCYTTPVFKTGAFGHSATSPMCVSSLKNKGFLHKLAFSHLSITVFILAGTPCQDAKGSEASKEKIGRTTY